MIRDGVIRKIGKDVVVVGGGISGILASLELAKLGMNVKLLERENSLGGVLKSVPRILVNGEVLDTSTLVDSKIKELSSLNVDVVLETEVLEIEGFVGEFRVITSKGDVTASQVVIATGVEYRPGSGRTLCDQLSFESELSEAIPGGLRVCFFLDSYDWDYKVSTVNAFKQALILKEAGADVTFVARDYKVSFEKGEEIFRLLREKGVRFFKVESFPSYAELDKEVRIRIKDELFFGKNVEYTLEVDRLVVPVGWERGKSRLLRYLRVDDSFPYREDNPQLFLNHPSFKKGVYFVGSCTYPMILDELIQDVKDASFLVSTINERLSREADLPFARVNPEKCALCLTCLRNCPSGSITFKVYEGKRNVYYIPYLDDGRSFEAAYVDPTSCFGCGICASECPAKAIELVGLEDEKIVSQLGV